MSIQIYPFPATETVSKAFSITINGQPIPVHEARVSADPINQAWPGYQRPIAQTELAYFISFALDEAAQISITPEKDFQEVIVRPLSKRINPLLTGRTIILTLSDPGGYTVELDGYHQALHIFADPVKEYYVNPEDPNTLYFGPGIHDAGLLYLKSWQTVFIDAGAVVHASLHALDAEGIRILGRGILDNSQNKEENLPAAAGADDPDEINFDAGGSRRRFTIQLTRCRNIEIDGITIRDSLVFNLTTWGCEDIRIDNIKTIGCWRYNSDGIDLYNSSRCSIRNCFIRSFDDSICIKGDSRFPCNCQDILIENCVIWCDWGHALEIGAETRANHMRCITWRNCDIIRNRGIALDIMNVDYGDVHDILYEDIRVEYDPVSQPQQFQETEGETYRINKDKDYMPLLIGQHIIKHSDYSGGLNQRGHIHDITFRGIDVFACRMPPSRFFGYDGGHRVAWIRLSGLKLNGEKISDINAANITCGEFAEAISVEP